ncbi:MAG: hypothetical protein HY286_16375 [Planctomycetes bacterium]|nr:hypothetical protein [Planctomycetota bacterium]
MRATLNYGKPWSIFLFTFEKVTEACRGRELFDPGAGVPSTATVCITFPTVANFTNEREQIQTTA